MPAALRICEGAPNLRSVKPRALACAAVALTLGWIPFPTSASAQSTNTPPESLHAHVLPTVQYAHNEIWNHTPSGIRPELATTDTIAPGQRLDLLILVGGYQTGENGRAHVTSRLTIHRPDDTTLDPPPELLITDSAPPGPDALLFPAQIGAFVTEPGDQTGDYRFTFTVHDHVSGSTLEKSAVVTVSASNEPLAPPPDFDLTKFMANYYSRPNPRLALPALVAFSHTEFAQRKAEAQGAILGFYERILADNPWLLPQFEHHLTTTTDARERRLFALALAFAQPAEKAFNDLPRTARHALAAARRERLPFPDPKPTTGGQLDVHWGRFMASGRFSPIADLVTVVRNYAPSAVKAPAQKEGSSSNPPTPSEQREAIFFRTALWSLGSNARQHPIVRAYLIGLQRADDTDAATKAALRFALEWKPSENKTPPP